MVGKKSGRALLRDEGTELLKLPKSLPLLRRSCGFNPMFYRAL